MPHRLGSMGKRNLVPLCLPIKIFLRHWEKTLVLWFSFPSDYVHHKLQRDMFYLQGKKKKKRLISLFVRELTPNFIYILFLLTLGWR